jgi:hypothetical protein
MFAPEKPQTMGTPRKPLRDACQISTFLRAVNSVVRFCRARGSLGSGRFASCSGYLYRRDRMCACTTITRMIPCCTDSDERAGGGSE